MDGYRSKLILFSTTKQNIIQLTSDELLSNDWQGKHFRRGRKLEFLGWGFRTRALADESRGQLPLCYLGYGRLSLPNGFVLATNSRSEN